MSSRDGYRTIDMLIVEALRAQVEGAQPSPHVWRRIRRQAAGLAFLGWAVAARAGEAMRAFLPGGEGAFDAASLPSGGPLCWRYEPTALLLLGVGRMAFRLGW